MGVDYSGHYGVGYKINQNSFDDENSDFERIEDMLDEKLDCKKYHWFQVGKGNYTGEQNDVYIGVKNPFEHGIYALKEKDEQLRDHISEIGLTVVNQHIDEIGGFEMS